MKKIALLLFCFSMIQFGLSQEIKRIGSDTVAPHLVLKREISLAQFDSMAQQEERKKMQIKFTSAIDKFDVKMVSPDGKYVVAFNMEHIYTDKIYFFSIEGILLADHFIGFTPNVKYSQSGDYLELFNDVGKQFYVFSKDGNLIKSGDYQKVLGIKNEFMTNVYWNEGDQSWSILTNKRLHYMDFNDNVKWDLLGIYRNIQFDNNKQIIYTTSYSVGKKEIDLIVLSQKNGKLIDRLRNINSFFILNNLVYILEKNNKINYYEIK